ncbi:transketolase [Lasius niger]|uniref:Transketolase n=1 Tax=Lasius niger TaxID=67767 RepID=A0A0J7KTN0_LASNI|nr:transketolase [Lasius niger]
MVRSAAYDLVLNGYEIAGGSVRIFNKVLQEKIFEILNLNQNIVDKQFGFFLEAFNYGIPPHAGIAFGLDRFIMILTNSSSIRDSIAFPKNNSGIDLLTNAPSLVDFKQLDELAGHGSALLYSILYHVGYDYKIEDLKDFRKIDSVTPGHPEYDLKLGVEMATGPLGQGLAAAVGMALAESFLAAKYNQDKSKLIDHYTYVLCSDGDLQEGITQEALSFAGHFKLNKLIVLYDSNDVQLDSETELVTSENTASRSKRSDKPTLIEIKTIIGFGATKQGTSAVHGAPLMTDIATVKTNLAWDYQEEFYVPQEVLNHLQKEKIKQGQEQEKK